MKRTRAGVMALVGAAVLAVVVDPAAAQATSQSTSEDLIWGLNTWLLYMAIPIAILVEAILIYTVWKYRKNENPLPTRENRRLEITWTIATALVLVAVGIGSYTVMADPHVAGPQPTVDDGQEPLEVKVIGQRYAWTFDYPEATLQEITGTEATVTNSNTLIVPEGREIELNVTSTDWLHSFHVPGLGLKQDAFPAQWQSIYTEATDTGTYQLYCAEYCGSGHSGMLGTVEVRTQEDFETWLSDQAS
ncbi:MAG: cytochrome c oxidase subunit II [Haloarculaceae archaeon]